MDKKDINESYIQKRLLSGWNGQEMEPSSSNLDNLLTSEMFPEISRNV